MDDKYRNLLFQVAILSDVVLAVMEADCEFRSLLMRDENFIRNAGKHKDLLVRYDQAIRKASTKMKEFLILLEDNEHE